MSTRKVLLVLLCVYCVLCLVILASSTDTKDLNEVGGKETGNEREKIDRIEPRRRKKHKYFIPLVTAALLIKSVLFPLAFKSMAIMAGISIILSVLSLLVSSMVGFAKTARDSYQYADRRTQNASDNAENEGLLNNPPHPNGLNPNQNGGCLDTTRLVLGPKLRTYGFKHSNVNGAFNPNLL